MGVWIVNGSLTIIALIVLFLIIKKKINYKSKFQKIIIVSVLGLSAFMNLIAIVGYVTTGDPHLIFP
ncbi:hypothetical protein BK120_23305 [Paenibacillus sp. FSL A5-0031]|uniref:hypothetical protein n=1 Tax=Paenibacillus sp. FSL A5-0031 TaxID=1920420 RepID=UPI00096EBE68|nr:hypothetical protein [Paenibacillus sp. FSL A5-0031]OME78669.1 hypothetical protein BK120_23305 [Paenibacillus sp. FSL A5-0031]